MRARFFRWLLHRWETDTPEIVRRVQLQILMDLTAKAFRAPGKRLWTRPWRDGLRLYAEYTREHCECADPQQLYRMSFAMGERLRRITGFTDASDLRRLVFWLYRGIGIAMDNALDYVKAAADAVTASCDADGVAQALEKYIFDAE